MRTYKNLYSQIYDFENLYNAYRKARKNHRYKEEVLIFTDNLESELIQLQNDLIWKTYRTSKYRTFHVHDPKTRLVASLSFRDRVLQHAVCNVIEPLFDRRFIFDSYACRINKGTHAGADRVTEFLRRMVVPGKSTYCLKADIKAYFPSIKHSILIAILQRTIKCDDTIWLLKEIISSWTDDNETDPKGLPIGNLTSQLFANIYLDQLDHFVKERLRIKCYVRYMDDFVIIANDKRELWHIKEEIENFLRNNLELTFNGKTGIFPISHGIDFLGYRIWPDYRLLRKRSTKRIKRALRHFQKRYADGTIELDQINSTIQSWLGHAMHANSYRFRVKLFEDFKLTKHTE